MEAECAVHALNVSQMFLRFAVMLLIITALQQPHRPPSKNNRKVLKISYIKGKYLGNRYLPLVFVYVLHVPNAE